MSEQRHPHVIHQDDLEWAEFGDGGQFGSRNKRLGAHVGGQDLGCSLYEVQPGKAAFPFHAHGRNEEAVYVLAGEGELRIGEGSEERRVSIRAGDYVAFPANLRMPHQIRNSGADTLRYLCMSTTALPEVVRYPDSGKVGMMAAGEESPEGWPQHRGRGMKLLKDGESLGYFDGE